MPERMSSAEFQRVHGSGGQAATVDAKPQIRLPKRRQPNKTETAWWEQLKRRHHPATASIFYEPISLNLPSGTRYTPDFMVLTHEETIFWEVKGAHIHNQRSIHAFKEARSAFPFWRFGFAQLVKGDWRVVFE
jgi:hypothetical protein